LVPTGNHGSRSGCQALDAFCEWVALPNSLCYTLGKKEGGSGFLPGVSPSIISLDLSIDIAGEIPYVGNRRYYYRFR
jgi:hypothetical protein